MNDIYVEEKQRLEQARLDLLNAKNMHLAAISAIDEAIRQTHERMIANDSLIGQDSI